MLYPVCFLHPNMVVDAFARSICDLGRKIASVAKRIFAKDKSTIDELLKNPKRNVIASAEVTVKNTTVELARKWFIELQDHPERYVFDTHKGITVEEGKSLQDKGTLFWTKEKFGFGSLKLKFQMEEIGDKYFNIQLKRFGLPVWGRFEFDEGDNANEVKLKITIGTRGNSLVKKLLHTKLIKKNVGAQILKEANHIGKSIEYHYPIDGPCPDHSTLRAFAILRQAFKK